MNCLEFLDRLDELLAGTCTPEVRLEVERHGAECRACRELLADVRRVELGAAIEEAQPLDAVEAEELTAAVLRRTAGSPCGRALELLAERVFHASREARATTSEEARATTSSEEAPARTPPKEARATTSEDARATTSEETRVTTSPSREADAIRGVARASRLAIDDPLLAQHLEHCTACAAVAEAMALAARTLPSLAELEPDPWFVRAVMARTSRARRADRRLGLLAVWRGWMARPRFAFELAYVATLLLVLLVGNPADTLQAASRRTANVAAASLEKAKIAWPPAGAVDMAAVPERAMNDFRGEMAVRQGAFRAAFERAWSQASETWLSTLAWLGSTASSLADAANDFWHRVTRRGTAAAEPPARPAR